MPTLNSYSDDQIIDHMNGLAIAQRKRIMGPGVPKDPSNRVIYEITEMMRAHFNTPDIRAMRVGYIRDFDSRVPYGAMSADDVLIMNYETGGHAIKTVLQGMPEMAEACNFAAHAHHAPDDAFPYDGLVSLAFNKVDADVLHRFVTSFHAVYPQAQAEADRRAVEGINTAAHQMAGMMAQKGAETADMALAILNEIMEVPHLKASFGQLVLPSVIAQAEANMAKNRAHYASLGIEPGPEPALGTPAFG